MRVNKDLVEGNYKVESMRIRKRSKRIVIFMLL